MLRDLATFQARERVAAVTPDASGRRVIIERIASGSLETLRPLALAVAAHDGAIFIGASE